MRGFDNDETAQIFTTAFRDYRNFVRPHMG